MLELNLFVQGEPSDLIIKQIRIVDDRSALKTVYPSRTDLDFDGPNSKSHIRVKRCFDWLISLVICNKKRRTGLLFLFFIEDSFSRSPTGTMKTVRMVGANQPTSSDDPLHRLFSLFHGHLMESLPFLLVVLFKLFAEHSSGLFAFLFISTSIYHGNRLSKPDKTVCFKTIDSCDETHRVLLISFSLTRRSWSQHWFSLSFSFSRRSFSYWLPTTANWYKFFRSDSSRIRRRVSPIFSGFCVRLSRQSSWETIIVTSTRPQNLFSFHLVKTDRSRCETIDRPALSVQLDHLVLLENPTSIEDFRVDRDHLEFLPASDSDSSLDCFSLEPTHLVERFPSSLLHFLQSSLKLAHSFISTVRFVASKIFNFYSFGNSTFSLMKQLLDDRSAVSAPRQSTDDEALTCPICQSPVDEACVLACQVVYLFSRLMQLIELVSFVCSCWARLLWAMSFDLARPTVELSHLSNWFVQGERRSSTKFHVESLSLVLNDEFCLKNRTNSIKSCSSLVPVLSVLSICF